MQTAVDVPPEHHPANNRKERMALRQERNHHYTEEKLKKLVRTQTVQAMKMILLTRVPEQI